MEEKKNLTQNDVLELISNFKLEPLYNKLYITLNNVKYDDGILLTEYVLSDEQFVVAVGDHVSKSIKPGDKVLIDIERLMVSVGSESNNQYENLKQVKLDLLDYEGNALALIDDRVIKAIDRR